MRKTLVITAAMMAIAMGGMCVSCSNDDEPQTDLVIDTPEEKQDSVAEEEIEEKEEFEYVERRAIPIELTEAERGVSKSLNAFGWDMLQKLLQEERKKGKNNVMISPLSIYTNLAMLLNGTQGETRAQALAAMGLGSDDMELLNAYMENIAKGIPEADPAVRFQSVNSLWYNMHYTPNATYSDILTGRYSAEMRPTVFDAATVDSVNKWCARATYQRIPKVIDHIDPGILAMLVNAVYFRGSWSDSFNEQRTKQEWFTQDDGQQVQVDMMENHTLSGCLCRCDGYRMLYLPFSNKAFAMQLILPDGDTPAAELLEGKLQRSDMDTRSISWGSYVHLKMPKMTSECQFLLTDIMEGMGAQNLFVPSPDFTIFDGLPMCVDQIIHNSFISIDEAGAEAAAVTTETWIGADIDGDEKEPQYTDFIMNRPYLYAIVETSTGCPLFMGYKGGE